ncbi:MAG: DMT family transporter [Nocardioides sp.]|nr:DMT family transporter [Nocardioides sp.]
MTSPTTTADATGRAAPPSRLPLAAVGVTLVLWASAFVAIRHLADDFSPGALSLGRVGIGAVALGVVAVGRPMPRPSRRDWLSLAVIGVLWFGIYHVALNEGEQRVDAGTASMLLQVSPVLIALLAAVFLHERFTTHLALGLALAFSGVALIGFSASPEGDRDVLGVVLCMVSAVAYAISLVLQKPLLRRISALHVTWIACTIGAVVCLPFAGQLVFEVRQAPASSVLWVVYLGIFPTAVAFTTYAYALSHMSAANLGVTTYLVPPITIVLGLLLLDETPPSIAYVGGALALAGVAVARRTSRAPAARPPA